MRQLQAGRAEQSRCDVGQGHQLTGVNLRGVEVRRQPQDEWDMHHLRVEGAVVAHLAVFVEGLTVIRGDEHNRVAPARSVAKSLDDGSHGIVGLAEVPVVEIEQMSQTGKTAAFALPLLSRINLKKRHPQVLILTPTRELAIQVAESFKTYGAGMKGLNVLSIYGGQSYGTQLNQLKRGVHVIVGTPGRLMDHMRKKTVSFADLFCVILDEADEMLHMGFIDDVEWILGKTPDDSQIALFSATMPKPIRKIAQKYLTSPKEIIAKSDKTELETINQQYWMIKGIKKIKALIRIMEAVTFDGVIVFTKTKAATLEVAKALESKGFKAEALNGDLAQSARERTINRLKNGYIDI